MLQKMIRVGNSFAVTIPRRFIDSFGVSEEALIEVRTDMREGRMTLNFMKEKRVVDEVIDPEVYRVAQRLLKRYLPAFKELAKK